MRQHIKHHIARGLYRPAEDAHSFESIFGWRDHLIGEHLLYSHRETDYKEAPALEETHHFHDYFELQLYISGEVDFVSGQEILAPRPLAAVWFRPGEMHNTRMPVPGVYRRAVFYFRPAAFRYEGTEYPLTALLEKEGRNCFEIPTEHRERFFSLLESLDKHLGAGKHLAAFADTVVLFETLGELLTGAEQRKPVMLPEHILAVKNYIDENYATIGSVEEVAGHFFYSREYISRLFRKYCNTGVAEYITRYRLKQSLRLLESGAPVTEVCFAVGFGSMSAFIAAFKKTFGLLPSEYAKRST